MLLARARLLSGEFAEGRALLDALRSAGPDRPGGAALDSSRHRAAPGPALRGRGPGPLRPGRPGRDRLGDRRRAARRGRRHRLRHAGLRELPRCTPRPPRPSPPGTATPSARRTPWRSRRSGHLFTGDEATALDRATRAAELIDAARDTTLLTNLAASLQLGMTEGLLGPPERQRAPPGPRRVPEPAHRPDLPRRLPAHRAGQRPVPARQAAARPWSPWTASPGATTELGEHGGNPSEEAVAANLRGRHAVLARRARRRRAGAGRGGPGARRRQRLVHQLGHGSPLLPRRAGPVHGRPGCAPARCCSKPPARTCRGSARGAAPAGATPWPRPRWPWATARTPRTGPPSPRVLRSSLRRCVPSRCGPGCGRTRAAGDYEAALTRAQEAVREFTARGERIEVCRTLLAAPSSR